jgi:hypothetical protein
MVRRDSGDDELSVMGVVGNADGCSCLMGVCACARVFITSSSRSSWSSWHQSITSDCDDDVAASRERCSSPDAAVILTVLLLLLLLLLAEGGVRKRGTLKQVLVLIPSLLSNCGACSSDRRGEFERHRRRRRCCDDGVLPSKLL